MELLWRTFSLLLLLSARSCLSWSSIDQTSYVMMHSYSCSRVQKPRKVDLLKRKHLKYKDGKRREQLS